MCVYTETSICPYTYMHMIHTNRHNTPMSLSLWLKRSVFSGDTRAGACERAGDITRVDATWRKARAEGPKQGTHTGDPHRGDPHRGPPQRTQTGDPHRGEGPTEHPPPEGRVTQGTHTGRTKTTVSGVVRLCHTIESYAHAFVGGSGGGLTLTLTHRSLDE